MRSLVALAVLSTVLTLGCDSDRKDPVADTMIKSYHRAQDAASQANLDAVRNAVQAYQAANGKYPEALEDVRPLMGGDIDLSQFEYDRNTGRVTAR